MHWTKSIWYHVGTGIAFAVIAASSIGLASRRLFDTAMVKVGWLAPELAYRRSDKSALLRIGLGLLICVIGVLYLWWDKKHTLAKNSAANPDKKTPSSFNQKI